MRREGRNEEGHGKNQKLKWKTRKKDHTGWSEGK
jgi:hypothetical protein